MDLLIESQQRRQVASLFDARTPRLPAFQLGDTVPLAIAEVEEIATPISDRLFEPQDLSGITYRVALGIGFQLPVAGTIPFSYIGDTANEVLVNGLTAGDIESALNSLDSIAAAGYVEVTGEDGFFVVSFREEGARELISAEAGALVPASLIDIARQVTGADDEWEVQVIRIVQSAGAIATLSTASASAGIGVETVQVGSPSPAQNHVVRVTLTGDIYSGTWTFLTVDGESTPIRHDATPGQIKRALAAISGLEEGNVSVEQESARAYLLTFIGAQILTPIDGVAVNGANLVAMQTKSGELPLTGPALQMLLKSADAKVVSLEIEKQVGSNAPQKILQRSVLLTRPVIEPAMDDTEQAVSNVAAVIATFVGSGSALTVSSTDTTDIAPATPFIQWTQRIAVNAGSGAYTRKITLDTSNAVEGAKLYVILTIAASNNPTIQFFSDTISSQIGDDIVGDVDNAQSMTVVFTFEGGAWKFDGYLQ